MKDTLAAYSCVVLQYNHNIFNAFSKTFLQPTQLAPAIVPFQNRALVPRIPYNAFLVI
jgi:hypothetical protein